MKEHRDTVDKGIGGSWTGIGSEREERRQLQRRSVRRKWKQFTQAVYESVNSFLNGLLSADEDLGHALVEVVVILLALLLQRCEGDGEGVGEGDELNGSAT